MMILQWKNMNLEWKMNDFCTSFLDHLHIDNGEHVDFSSKNDVFSINNDDFYMICSTFVDHLYTENWENDYFAVEKTWIWNEKMNDFCTCFLDHLHIDNGEK